MLNDKIPDRLRDLVAEVLNVPLDALPTCAGLGNPGEWDSLSHVQIMLAIEEVFAIELTSDVIMNAKSLEAIEAHLQHHMGLGS